LNLFPRDRSCAQQRKIAPEARSPINAGFGAFGLVRTSVLNPNGFFGVLPPAKMETWGYLNEWKSANGGSEVELPRLQMNLAHHHVMN
jgi:hypothetical protein